MIRNFRDLIVWKKAHELTLLIYRATAQFPYEERFHLVSQLRRASSSTAANIVEGWGRRTDRDTGHFLNIAHCSNDEVKYFLILARDLELLSLDLFQRCELLADEIGAMLFSLENRFNSFTAGRRQLTAGR